MAKSNVDITALKKTRGKPIKDICDIGYDVSNDNHCAHFVSHIMEYEFGPATCSNLTWALKQAARTLKVKGKNVRVNSIFMKCPEVGEWGDKGDSLTSCLAFITKKSNVKTNPKHMGSIRQKHMGIFVNNQIWHYSNSKNKVVNQTVEEFKKHFGSSQLTLAEYQLYYGTFPK